MIIDTFLANTKHIQIYFGEAQGEFQIIMMLISKFKAILIVLTLTAGVGGTVCPTGSSAIANCLTCSTSGSTIICNGCINGYYLASTACVACSSVVANCIACSLNLASQPTCYICQSGWGLLGGQCANCTAISGCATCQVSNYNLQCTACSPGLVLYSAQMQCIPCVISNCNNCSVNNAGNYTCTACINGYYLNGKACTACSNNISNCASCLFDQNGRLICSACASLWLFLSNNTCTANCTKGGYSYCKTCQIVSLATNSMICTSCVSNFYLDAASNCLSCSQALTGCTNCSLPSSSTENDTASTVVCSACSSNYFLSSNPATCVLCNTVKPNCQTCNFDFTTQTGTCTSCSPGFYLNSTDQSCYACTATANLTASFPAGSCAVCSIVGSGLTCSACMNSYFLVNSTCKTCGQLQINCSTCSNNTVFTCLSCTPGSILNAVGQCSLCSSLFPNCNFCSVSECTDCLPGYYTINNKNCLADCAVSNCNKCVVKNNGQCTSCRTGYLLAANGTCAMIGCSSPLSFNGLACICPYQSYYQQAGNTCLPCSDPACQTCPEDQCNQCLNGFFLHSNACSKCINNCLFCNSTNDCLLCAEGFAFQGGKCSPYIQVVYGGVGVVLNANFYQLCGLGCSQCTSTACLYCEQGFFLNGSACSFCPANCKVCTLIANSTDSTATPSLNCLVCKSGMALTEQTCSSCTDPNCVNCDYNTYFCLLCSITFTADAYGVCQPCASNCNFCDVGGAGTCDDFSCFLGYAKYNISTCMRCLNGCSSCNTTYPFACIGCLLGSYAVIPKLTNVSNTNATNTTNTTNTANTTPYCLNCDYGCDECTGPKACLSCSPNFNLANGICNPLCVLPCVACSLSANNSQICSSCLLGYVLSNGSCVGDYSCLSSKICEFCPLGYFADQGSCHTCSSNCAQCTFAPGDPAFVVSGNNYVPYLNCTQCGPGFYLDPSLACFSCPKNCSQCLSPSSCTHCLPGYFLQYKLLNGVNSLNYSVGICQSCAPGCKECVDEPNRCISCPPSFFLVNFVCKSKYNITFTYVLVSPNNVSDSGILAAITSNLPQLELEIANSFGTIFSKNRYLVMITSITNGSVVVSGDASIDNNTYDPSTAYNSLSANVQQTKSICDYKVGSYSITANGFTPTTPSATTTSPSSDYLLYVIIGSAVVGISALAIIVFLCVRKARKQEEVQDDQVVTTEKAEEQQHEPATSKNMLKSEQLYPKSSVRVQDEFSRSHKKRDSRQPQETSHRLQEASQRLQEVSHISGNKTVVQPVNEERRTINLVPTIHEEEDPSQENSKSKSKSKSKSRSKPKTSNYLPESNAVEEPQRYTSVKTIQIPTRDFPQKSKAEQHGRQQQIEQPRNNTNSAQNVRTQKYESQKESSNKKSNYLNSISKKYIPNSNSHFI